MTSKGKRIRRPVDQIMLPLQMLENTNNTWIKSEGITVDIFF